MFYFRWCPSHPWAPPSGETLYHHNFQAYIDLQKSKRGALCGWKENKTKTMADDVYLRLEQSYPYHKRKNDIDTIIKLYPWFNESYYL